MQITFYKNKSEKHKLDKTLETVSTLSGSLKEETSIVNPTIMIESSSPITANYCYIPEFGRYYFIKNVDCVRANLWKVSMECDVLSTYKSQIRSCNAALDRQQYNYNMYIQDPLFITEADTFTITNKIGNTVFDTPKNILLISSTSMDY